MTSSTPQSIARSIRNLHPLFVAVVLALLCLASYSNSFNNGFLMDDYPMLIKHPNISSPEFLRYDFSKEGPKLDYFRPIERVFLFLNHSLFKDQPAGYHLVNLAFFYLSCLAMYQLLTALLKDKPTAFLTVVLFAAHPINSIIIDYKNATYFSVLLLVMTLGLLHNVRNIGRPVNFLREALPLVWCAIALLSHEIAVAYPLYLAAVLYFGCGRTFKETFLRSLPSALLVGAYILFRFFFFSLKEGVLQNMHMTLLTYTASLGKAVGWYLSKLIGLQDLIMAWNAAVLPREVLHFNALFVLMLGLAVYFLWRARRDDPRKLGLVWFVIGLLPFSIACFSRPIFGFAMQPHWMLFGSIGFFLFLGTTLRQLGNTVNKQAWVAIVMIIMVAYVLHTRHYNYLWGTQERYCRHWLSVQPESSWANYWLGYDRMEHGDFAEAEKYFTRSITGSMADAASYANLGYIKRVQGRLREAASDYENSLRFDANNAQTYFWLGYVWWELSQPAKAETCFKRAVKLDRSLADAVKTVKFSVRK